MPQILIRLLKSKGVILAGTETRGRVAGRGIPLSIVKELLVDEDREWDVPSLQENQASPSGTGWLRLPAPLPASCTSQTRTCTYPLRAVVIVIIICLLVLIHLSTPSSAPSSAPSSTSPSIPPSKTSAHARTHLSYFIHNTVYTCLEIHTNAITISSCWSLNGGMVRQKPPPRAALNGSFEARGLPPVLGLIIQTGRKGCCKNLHVP